LASLEKIKTHDEMFVDFVDQRYKFLIDYIGDMADMIGTSNVNVHVKQQRKTMMPGRKRLLETKDADVKYIPGVGKVKIVPNLDWDD